MSSNGHANTSNSTSTMTENGGSRSGSDPSNLLPEAKHYQLRGGLPNSPLSVSIISALLGGLLFAPLAFAVQPWLSQLGANEWTWARPQLGVYLGCMGLFHLCEFWTTAGWNPHKLTVDGACSLVFVCQSGLD
jgi:protein-S-isoprenylcysteine O-methyltransferase